MKLFWRFPFAAFFTLVASASLASDNPLAQATLGKIECFMPDHANKTCMAISTYVPNQHGTYDDSDEIVLDAERKITIKLKGEATIIDGMICQKLQSTSLERAEFNVGGQSATQQQVEQINSDLLSGFKALMGKTSCMKLTEKSGQFQVEYIIDNQPFATPPMLLEWIDRGSGYRLKGQSD